MKVTVIGRGFGAKVMAPAYRALGFEADIISSRDAAEVARACQSPADLISVHAPPFQHLEIVMAALSAGRNVLCDKPFGRNASEARAMRDAAVRAGVLHFLNFEFRCQPAWVKAKELLSDGTIGTLTHVSWSSFGSGMRGRRHGWLHDANLAGGWIGAYGSHVIDALRYFFGREIGNCGGMVRTETPSRPDDEGNQIRSTAEDSFSCWFAMTGGGTVSVDTGYAASVNLPSRIDLLGTDGAISILRETQVTVTRPNEPQRTIDLSPKPGDPVFPAVPLWLERVAAALQQRRQIAPNFDDGLAAADVMDRLKAAVVTIG